MSRAVTIGNGKILVGLDNKGQVRDFYYPSVGLSNHVSGASGNFVHRIGIFADGSMSWLDDPAWEITLASNEETSVGSFFAVNHDIGVSLSSTDAVHNEENVFLRRFSIANEFSDTREIKIFFAQQFRIRESRRGDTALYDPRVGAIVHYKEKNCFLVNAFHNGKQFSDYNIGLFGIEGKQGTYLDAEDGILERNPVEHGSVDSVIGMTCEISGKSSQIIHYWITCGSSIPEVHTLDEYVIEETPERLIAATEAYWQAWVDKEGTDISALSEPLQKLYKRSLIIMRVHSDNDGGIIASSDTDMLHHGRDTYSYVWPRDAAIIAHALDKAGYTDMSQQFFQFMTKCLEPGGYLMHKYSTDGTLGSSWHPWMRNGEPKLPIQEDETASMIFFLWKHYEINKDLEFIESLYNTFIEPAAKFLCDYIEPTTGLPQDSYDLWEEKYGSSTYTASSVYGGLTAAAHFAALLGKDQDSRTYQAIAQRMQKSIKDYLYDEGLGMFIKHVEHTSDGELVYDNTLDSSSFYGPILYEVFDLDDEMITTSLATIEKKLQVTGGSEGFIRYEGDGYYRMQNADSPNPWVVTTMWVAQYLIKKAENPEDLERPYQLMEWTCSHATQAGVLSEQMHPNTREHLSTSPLIWSHAEYVLTVQAYIEKIESFKSKE